MMDGSNKRGRPHREWSNDIEQRCGATLQELSHAFCAVFSLSR